MTNDHDSARPDAVAGIRAKWAEWWNMEQSFEDTCDDVHTLLTRLDACEAALKQIARHEIDKRYWDTLADSDIAEDCETAHDDLVAWARQALAADGEE